MAPPPAAAVPAAAAVDGGAHNVFVYGSLMTDEVVRTIIKRVPPSSPAILPNFHRFNVKGRIYPAILPVQSKKVAGKVITGVTDAELHILDEFEDVEYVRRRVEITLADTSLTMLADTYVWADAEDPNLYGEWDFEEWKRLHMKDFLAMTNGFMDGLEQPESKSRVETYQSFMQEIQHPGTTTTTQVEI
uniref:Putative gamma-glutamylcyclotransferase n=1 Tax=Oryza punctata TaxID=4537 RepID=A0A0E0LFB9_ORYPU